MSTHVRSSIYGETSKQVLLQTVKRLNTVAGVEHLPALHYSVDFIFLSFGIMGFIVELWNY